MKHSEKNSSIVFTIKTESVDDFFARGKELAKALDHHEDIQTRRIISFEDPKDLISFLNEAKLILLRAIRKKPDSISKLAEKLHRSRSSIDKDVQLLESVGIVESEYVINPGHGRQRIIKAIDANPIKLHVETII